MERVLKNRKTINVIAAILAAGATLLFSAVPAFASSQSVGQIDSDSISMSNMAAILRTVQSQYIPDGATEMRMPVYLSFSNISSVQAFSYLSGYLYYGATMNAFGLYTGGNAQVVRTYFESVDNDSLSAVWVEGQSLRLYFDNYRFDNPNSTGYIYVGDIIYKFDAAATGFTYITPNSTTSSMTPSGYLRGTAYEYGFVEAMAYAISTAQSTQDVLQWLTYIEQDTRYAEDIYQILSTQYPLVLQALATIDQHVLQIYYQLAQMNAAQSSEAAAIEDEINQKASQSAVLSDDMAVNKPQLSGDDINISDLIDSSVNTQFGGFLGTIVQNNFITTMFLIALSCMIIGFVLYGKK